CSLTKLRIRPQSHFCMGGNRLRLLFLSQFPPSPPSSGAQRRIQGLMTALARDHDVTCVALVGSDLDAGAVERAMRSCSRAVARAPMGPSRGLGKRLSQLRAVTSPRSFERRLFDVPALRHRLQQLLANQPFDVVSVEFPFLANQRLDLAPPGV